MYPFYITYYSSEPRPRLLDGACEVTSSRVYAPDDDATKSFKKKVGIYAFYFDKDMH